MELDKLRQISDGGGSTEELIAEMRKFGCSKIESIKLLMGVQGISLGQAKQLVHDSPTWRDRKDSDEQFQEGLISHLDNAGKRHTE
jgi:ribosomal protein L7/L12